MSEIAEQRDQFRNRVDALVRQVREWVALPLSEETINQVLDAIAAHAAPSF